MDFLLAQVFFCKEAVQQFKIGRKREANRALNPKRSKIFGVKSNCETASKKKKCKESLIKETYTSKYLYIQYNLNMMHNVHHSKL